MIDLLHAGPSSQTHIRVNAGFRSNLVWWDLFADNWNGISFLPPPSHLPSVEVTTDASGSWGWMHGAAAHGSSFGGIIDLYLFP